MYALRAKIKDEGRAINGAILKVDGFINHRVDAALMEQCGATFARRFVDLKPDIVLTAEISGIAPALMTGAALGCAVVYARKKRPVTMHQGAYVASAPSRTKGGEPCPLIVSPEFLKTGERVLIIDDFLASGQTILGLIELCRQANATIVGVGALVEKTFENGRDTLRSALVDGQPIETLAQITSLEDGIVEVAP